LNYTPFSDAFSNDVIQIIKDDKAFDPLFYDNFFKVDDDNGTAHMSFVAPNGDAVAMTSSINSL
jgi:gamma-glutamyltranspeptidase / glutathione hydrolase / leukotriene-C4 hydrolase